MRYFPVYVYGKRGNLRRGNCVVCSGNPVYLFDVFREKTGVFFGVSGDSGCDNLCGVISAPGMDHCTGIEGRSLL